MTEIERIENDQKDRFKDRTLNMYNHLDKKTRKQVKYIGEKLKFMFSHDVFGCLNAEIQVFQLVFNSPLTLDVVQNQVLTNGQKAASKKITISEFLKIIKDEFMSSRPKEVTLTDEEMKASEELLKLMNKS